MSSASSGFLPPVSCEELHARMVAFDTVNEHYCGRASGEAALAAFLEMCAQQWGLHTQRLPVDSANVAAGFNLFIGSAPLWSGGEWLFFDSHLDTVAVAGMSVPPFVATRRGTRIHGRGACDTKGSGASMLWALRECVRSTSGRVLPRHVGIFFTVDEEAGMTGAAAVARTLKGLADSGARIRGVVVGEPTELHPVVAHNGLLRWTFVTHGVAAHSSNPSRGRSAISAMVRVVEALERDYVPLVSKRAHPLTGGAAASINVISGGSQINVIPERCEIEMDRRLAPQESPESALQELNVFLDSLVTSEPSLVSGVERIVDPNILAPVDSSSSENRELLALVLRASMSVGFDAVPCGARYATNGSHYAAAGLPVLVLGPGNIAQAHTADEWIEVAQLELAVRVFSALMARA